MSMQDTQIYHGNAGLLVSDMQTGFLDKSHIPFINRVARVMAIFAEQKIPIIATQFINHPAGPLYRLLDWKKMRFYPDIDIIQEVKNYRPKRIVKSRYSAFTDELKIIISQYDIRRLYLCGIEMDACILKTAFDAFEHNIRVKIITDACLSHADNAIQEATLSLLKRNIGYNCLVSSAELSRLSL